MSRAAGLAEELVDSALLGTGQFCTQPGLIIVPDMPGLADMVRAMVRRMEEKPCGPLLNRRIRDNLARSLEEILAAKEVTRLTGGAVPAGPGWRFTNTLLDTAARHFLDNERLQTELFGPVSLLIRCPDMSAMESVARHLGGQLTASVYLAAGEARLVGPLLDILRRKAGRLVFNSVPTGVEVCAAMMHGGPYPATTDARASSVGVTAIRRFLRPVAFQNAPPDLLPDLLQDENPAGVMRLVNGRYTRDPAGK
jgi:NADP-dependent aldehyde dehydrogenase